MKQHGLPALTPTGRVVNHLAMPPNAISNAGGEVWEGVELGEELRLVSRH